MRNINATVTITDAEGRTFDLTGDFTYSPIRRKADEAWALAQRITAEAGAMQASAALAGDLPGEGVDTVRWSEPIPMSATLTVKMSPSDGRRMARFVKLLREGARNRPRIASTRSRRARRTAATKRYRLFKQRCR